MLSNHSWLLIKYIFCNFTYKWFLTLPYSIMIKLTKALPILSFHQRDHIFHQLTMAIPGQNIHGNNIGPNTVEHVLFCHLRKCLEYTDKSTPQNQYEDRQKNLPDCLTAHPPHVLYLKLAFSTMGILTFQLKILNRFRATVYVLYTRECINSYVDSITISSRYGNEIITITLNYHNN